MFYGSVLISRMRILTARQARACLRPDIRPEGGTADGRIFLTMPLRHPCVWTSAAGGKGLQNLCHVGDFECKVPTRWLSFPLYVLRLNV